LALRMASRRASRLNRFNSAAATIRGFMTERPLRTDPSVDSWSRLSATGRLRECLTRISLRVRSGRSITAMPTHCSSWSVSVCRHRAVRSKVAVRRCASFYHAQPDILLIEAHRRRGGLRVDRRRSVRPRFNSLASFASRNLRTEASSGPTTTKGAHPLASHISETKSGLVVIREKFGWRRVASVPDSKFRRSPVSR
jgi:hypothetical protein